MGGNLDDTICAIATPLGEGGIGIVRISGAKAIETVSGILRLRSGQALSAVPSRTLNHADLIETASLGGGSAAGAAAPLDEVLVVLMRAPRSYTGEDLVEIHCHGGPFVLQAACQSLLRQGARLAEPGEFTKRAFLSGRLDLTQAEAVLDTIRAKTAGSLALAQAQLRGGLSQTLGRVRESLIRLLAHVEAAIDFTEEDISFIAPHELLRGLMLASADLERLAATARDGRILREGITVAIVGRPNVGKSSLLNALLENDRAIVTPIPGTTRDVLEEVLNIRGIPMRLLDTAGLRHTDDPVEQEGVRRTQAAMDQAELLVVLLDRSAPLTDDDRGLVRAPHQKPRLLVLNKSDLAPAFDETTLQAYQDEQIGEPIRISAKTGEGLDLLRDRMRAAVLKADFEPSDGVVVTRLRHEAALRKACEGLGHARESVDAQAPAEFIAMDLRAAIEALGEITGAVSTDDILDRIFREFCIGK
jgi:tRNA modification GTPase